ncbi:hypothetical protein HDV05_000123 [Chytridiales sp. JEL 0842]|nr:hypothetical protein HDV05_000123 [Chytridiales sp. JEL 0842]
MFWRFGIQSNSSIDALLEKENVTLDELFEDEDLLQDLCRPQVLAQLLVYVTAQDLDEAKRFKYPYIACEVIACEIYAVCEAVLNTEGLLDNFWKFLERPAPIDPLQASYFSKVNGVLIQKKAGEMAQFVRSQPAIISHVLRHIGNSSVAELLLKIISVEEVPEGQGIVLWLSQQGIIPSLVGRLDPTLEVEIHNTAAQTILDIIAVSYQNMGAMDQMELPSTAGGNSLVDTLKSEPVVRKMVDYMLDNTAPNAPSSLANGINIMIELIRRYCSEIEQAEYQQHHYQTQDIDTRPAIIIPTQEKLQLLSVDLSDLLKVVGERVNEFAALLTNPRNQIAADTTVGKVTPLGSERLKTCELFAEILHLQYLYFSSPLFERLVFGTMDGEPVPVIPNPDGLVKPSSEVDARKEMIASRQNVADALISVTEKCVSAKTLPHCLDLFFKYPWHNFLHSVVYDMIAKVFNTYTFTSTANFRPLNPDGTEVAPGGEPTPLETKMSSLKGFFAKLVLSILVEGELTKKITNAQRQNDFEIEQPKGVRLGYMGHLTYIADEVCKLWEKCAHEFQSTAGALVDSDEWQEYVMGVLRETKERDRQPLGGVRPTQGSSHLGVPMVTGAGGFGTNLDDTDIGVMKSTSASKGDGNANDSDDDDDISGGIGTAAFVNDGDVSSDQFARYLCQQIVNDFPDRGMLGGESSDEEEEDEEDGVDVVVSDIDGASANESGLWFQESHDNPFPKKISSLGDGFEDDMSSEDDRSDNASAEKVMRPTQTTVEAEKAAVENTKSFNLTELGRALPVDSGISSSATADSGTTTPAEAST